MDAAGRITGYTGKTEIGQNIRTSLAQAIADELRVPMAMVALTMADTDLVPFDQGTFGSLSTPRMAPVLARAAVTAREMLIDRAAALWSVDRGTLTCKDARITAAGRSIGFGDLVKDRKLAGIVPADAPVSPTAAWTIRGTAARKVNGRSFVTGEHRFTPDITRPGMMYGRVIRSDGYSGTLVSFDDAAARALGGVVVVRDGDFAGVVAPTERLARRAAAAIRAEWRMPAGAALVGDDLRTSEEGRAIGRRTRQRAVSGRRHRRCAVGRRPHVRRQLSHPLHRPRSARAARCRRGVDGRQAHRVDRHAAAVRRPRRAGGGVSRAGGARPRHRAGHRVCLWRQAQRRARRRSCAAGAGGRQAGQAGVDAQGGVLIRVLPSGRRDRREGRRRCGGPLDVVGVRQLELRRLGDPDALRGPEPAHPVPCLGLAASSGLVPRSRRDGQSLRARDAHGRHRARPRCRRRRLPAASPEGRTDARRPHGGGAEIRMAAPGAGGPRARHRLRHREGQLRRHRRGSQPRPRVDSLSIVSSSRSNAAPSSIRMA